MLGLLQQKGKILLQIVNKLGPVNGGRRRDQKMAAFHRWPSFTSLSQTQVPYKGKEIADPHSLNHRWPLFQNGRQFRFHCTSALYFEYSYTITYRIIALISEQNTRKSPLKSDFRLIAQLHGSFRQKNFRILKFLIWSIYLFKITTQERRRSTVSEAFHARNITKEIADFFT